MKIAIFSIYWGTLTGGIDTFSRDLARALSATGHDLLVAVQRHSDGLTKASKDYGFRAVWAYDARANPEEEVSIVTSLGA
jgi:Trk K+ transport system NAD-binding subunit